MWVVIATLLSILMWRLFYCIDENTEWRIIKRSKGTVFVYNAQYKNRSGLWLTFNDYEIIKQQSKNKFIAMARSKYHF